MGDTTRRIAANVAVDGAAIRKRRQDLGLTQKALADQLGFDQGYLSQVENSRPGVRRVGPALFRKLLDALDMQPAELRVEDATKAVA